MRTKGRGKRGRIQQIVLGFVDAESLQFAFRGKETEAVAIVEGTQPTHLDDDPSNFLDRSHRFAHGFGRVTGGHIFARVAKELFRETTVEALFRTRFKVDVTVAVRTAAILLSVVADDLVQLLPIIGRDVLHVTDVFQSAFNLE